MSALKTMSREPALRGQPIAHDQARSGGTGLVLFIGAFAFIVGLNIAAAKGREQLAIGLLFGLCMS